MRTRSERRHHHWRMVNKTKGFKWLKDLKEWFDDDGVDRKIKCVAENRKKCSCLMCGNPRKYWKEKTIQEKRFEAVMED